MLGSVVTGAHAGGIYGYYGYYGTARQNSRDKVEPGNGGRLRQTSPAAASAAGPDDS